MEFKTFTVREEHIKLLKNMNVTWNYTCIGAPTIDTKRPYGSTLVSESMAKIIGMKYSSNENDEIELTETQVDELLELHKEMETVLEILLYNCSIKPGIYVNKGYSNEWDYKNAKN